MPTDEEIETAIEVLNDIERAEADHAHKIDILDVRSMLVGVFGKEKFMADFEGDERIDTLKEVLQAVDEEDQCYTESDEVSELKSVGLEFAEIYDR